MVKVVAAISSGLSTLVESNSDDWLAIVLGKYSSLIFEMKSMINTKNKCFERICDHCQNDIVLLQCENIERSFASGLILICFV